MIRGKTLFLAITALALTAGSAAAQGFSFSYGIGDPYSDPYYRPYDRAYPGPPVYYDPPPVMIEPAQPDVRSRVVVSPEEVQADLEAQGFSRLGPLDARAGSYVLTAADPNGNFVRVIVSMKTGQIVDLRVLEPGPAARPVVPRAVPSPAPAVAAVPRSRPVTQTARPTASAPAAPQAAALPAAPQATTAPAPPQATAASAAPKPPGRASRSPASPAPKPGKDPLVVY